MIDNRPSNYLHYRYADSENQGLISNYYEKKDKIIFDSQLKEFDQRISKKVGNSKDADEIALIMQTFLSDAGKETLNQIFSPSIEKQSGVSSSAQSGIGNLSFAQLRANKTFLNEGRELVSDISSFKQGLDRVLNEIIKDTDQNYEALQSQVLLEAANGKSLSNTQLKREILAKIYDRNGQFLAANPNDPKYLTKSLKKLLALSYALSSAGGKTDVKVRQVSEAKVLQTLADKVTGWLNHTSGVLEEIAIATCINNGEKQLIEKLQLANKSIKGRVGGTALVDVTPDPTLQQYLDKIGTTEKEFKVQKEDVSLTVSADTVSCDIGFSIKKYTVKKGQKTIHISLNSGTSFLTALSNGGLLQDGSFMNAMMNAAAAHPGKGITNKVSISEGFVRGEWVKAKELAAMAAFLHNLAGTGKDKDNVLFLVLNRKVYTVPELIKMVAKNPKLISTSQAGLGWNTYQNMNTWNKESDLIRSAEVQRKVISRWQQVKINTGLKMLL